MTLYHHDPRTTRYPALAALEEAGEPLTFEAALTALADDKAAYAGLLHGLATGPGFTDASCVPDYSPHRPWVLVTISEDDGHAWVSLHGNGEHAAASLAEDVDVHGIRVDEAESFLFNLDSGSRWTPSLRTVVVWQ